MSFKSDMGEIQGKSHPETEFLSSCEYKKPNKLYVSKIQCRGRHKIDSPISKGRNKKEGRSDES